MILNYWKRKTSRLPYIFLNHKEAEVSLLILSIRKYFKKVLTHYMCNLYITKLFISRHLYKYGYFSANIHFVKKFTKTILK